MKDEIELIRQIKEGDRKALEAFVVTHHRVVVCIAKHFQNNGLPLLELIIKGNVGLVKAVYHFDEKSGYKFISYAIWCIRHSILKAIVKNETRKPVPLHRIGLFQKGANLLNNRFVRYFKQEPTLKEMAGMLDFQMKIMMDALQEYSKQLSGIDFMMSGKFSNRGNSSSPNNRNN